MSSSDLIQRNAVEQGHAGAQFNLGVMYTEGLGVKQEYAEAAKWFLEAATQGEVDAQYNLGWMYVKGQGVKQDYAAAMKWYRAAAEQELAKAQFSLGLMWLQWDGLPDSPNRLVQAYMWLSLAAEKGYEEARVYKAGLDELMWPTEREEGQQKAKRCLASGYKDCD